MAALSETARLIRSLRSASEIFSAVVIAIGCIVIVGWALDIELLKSVLTGRVTMKPNTALGLIFSGAGLWLWHRQFKIDNQKTKKQFIFLSLTFAGLTVLLGLLTLSEYGFGIDLRIDQILFHDSANAVDAAARGRMAPNTAFNFVCVGSAIVLLMRRVYRPAQALSLLMFLNALLALTGHLYTVTSFYSGGSVTGMAVHTAIAFFLLALGILFASADKGWMQSLSSPYAGGITARRLIPVAIAMPFILGLLVLLLRAHFGLSIATMVAFRNILEMVVLCATLWWNARSLNQVDANRLQVQQQLRQREQQFRAIFDQTFQFIGLMRPDGTLMEVNQTALDFGGLTAAEVIDQPFWQARWWSLSPQIQERLKDAIAQAASGEFVRYEVDVRGAGDRVATIDFSIKPVLDAQGNIILLIPEGRDITLLKQAEAELKRSQISRSLVGDMLRDLQERGNLSDSAMFQAGKELASRVQGKTLDDFLDAFASMGLGTLSLTQTQPNRWTFSADELVSIKPGQDQPTCHYPRGYLCGAIAQLTPTNGQIAAVEMACQSMNDSLCVFVVQVMN